MSKLRLVVARLTAVLGATLALCLGPTTAAQAQYAPPVLTKAFGSATVGLGEATSLTFTVHNPNAGVSLSGIAFTDALPAGLAARPGTLVSSCTGSVSVYVDGIVLSGLVLAGDGSCTMTLDVVAMAAGVQVNTTSTITSDQTAPGAAATATLTVLLQAVPTLDAWALALMALLVGTVAWRALAARQPATRRPRG